ncbi:MAG TPA: hypothetical protein VNH46_05745 [Gemmatimonadales bacterium]|nr:hypothetical protein [Gemmatimonadales bacterium]
MSLMYRFTRRLPRPVLIGTIVGCLLVLLVRQLPNLAPLGKPGELFVAGLTGLWTVQWSPPDRWAVALLAGGLAAGVVGLATGILGIVLAESPAPIGLLVGQATVAGMVGALVARLLREREAL